ncbi:MAG: hypothetical protein AAGG44_10205 [Planctomycetota bacterium]
MNPRLLSRICLFCFVTGVGSLSSVSRAQSTGESPVQAQAVAGEPFGVVVAEFPIAVEQATSKFRDATPRVLVSDSEGRLFYPSVRVITREVVIEADEPPARRIGRPGGLLDRVRKAVRGTPKTESVPSAVRVAALVRGSQPITMVLSGDINQSLSVVVEPTGRRHREMLNQWWSDYAAGAIEDVAQRDFPALVHQYLTSTLGRRLGLPTVDLESAKEKEGGDKEESKQLETLALLAAIEPLREEILLDVLNHPPESNDTNIPLPPAPAWQEGAKLPVNPATPIEDLARQVPPECFYLRFGSFSNYVWFQDIAERYGGDMAQAVLLRGFNYEASARMERMLAAKMTQIAKMFGDQLIGDMAVIGSDLYMKEGASLGVVFYAKNPGLLAAAIESDRKAIARQNEDASLQKLSMAGGEALLLSTPDNRIRSFYVANGPYICVTTSQTIARRFLEVSQGAPSLADSENFKLARSWMPDENDYSVFAYFSPEFFYRLVSPEYQIELRRRLEAIAHLEVAELASQVAVSEGISPDDIQALRDTDFLPPWFNQRADGAEAIRGKDRWVDSMRGARGSFLPIADVEIEQVTEQEAVAYAETAQFYQNEWKQMDPMIFGLRRFQSPDNPDREQIAFEGYIAPFEPEKYGRLTRMLASPSNVYVSLPTDDAATLQVHMQGNDGIGPKSGDYILFAGVKDMVPPRPEETEGLFKTLQALRAAPAYIGAWPKPGIMEQLPLGLGRALATPDFAGYSRMLGGLWCWQNEQFSLLSFDRSILDNAVPQLGVAEAEDLAQARLQVAPLKGSLLANWVNSVWYERGWRASHGNAKLMDVMHQQLRAPGDRCLETAQRLLDVKLQCPLGGQFEFVPVPVGAGGWWQSSAWQYATIDEQGRPTPPASYEAPWIDWFRGGKVHLTQGSNSVALIGQVDLELKPLSIQVEKEQTPSMLPKLDFDLFSLPSQLFGGKAAEPKAPTPERVKF